MNLLAGLPRAGLVPLASPLERWRRLEGALGGQEIWAKRDDVGAIGLGGSKLRKLDLILGEAVASGATTALTTGALQSNHCRLTAAAAAHLGLKSVLFLRGDPPEVETGNIVLNRLFGAEIVYTGPISHDQADERMTSRARDIRRNKGRPWVIPLGAATAAGTAAHVEATRELAEQCREARLQPAAIVVAVGSGSTLAGISLGAEHYLPRTRVIGISVSWGEAKIRSRAMDLISGASELLGLPTHLRGSNVSVRTDFIGSGYTLATRGAIGAVRMVGMTEGVLLDLTYTGKAFHGLSEMAARREFDGPVIFWHTGGWPELLSRGLAELQ